MSDSLEQLLQKLREEPALLTSGEEATRQGAVLPLLGRLGWDRDNIREVVPEYNVGNGRVDYCLRIGEQVSVFVEVKRAREDLDAHQEQLLGYAFLSGVKIAVLTNGLAWWLYLPLSEGSWEQRRFFTIDIQQQDMSEVAKHFRQFLGREAIADGSAVEKAETAHAGREKDRKIRRVLPEVWRDLCQRPDELLVDLVADSVESRCGHRPDDETVARFLADAVGPPDTPPPPPPVRRRRRREGTGTTSDGIWTHRTPVAYSFKARRHEVSSFKEILVGLCRTIYEERGQDFDRICSLRGRKRPYFARDYRNMTAPQEIPGTGIYAETCLSANAVRDRCQDVHALFGYASEDVVVELAQRAS